VLVLVDYFFLRKPKMLAKGLPPAFFSTGLRLAKGSALVNGTVFLMSLEDPPTVLFMALYFACVGVGVWG